VSRSCQLDGSWLISTVPAVAIGGACIKLMYRPAPLPALVKASIICVATSNCCFGSKRGKDQQHDDRSCDIS
jgi:hypothetical protein